MISIEKLESNLKSLNMTLFIWKILSLVMDVFGIAGYYMNMAILKHPENYEKSGMTSQQIEQLRNYDSLGINQYSASLSRQCYSGLFAF